MDTTAVGTVHDVLAHAQASDDGRMLRLNNAAAAGGGAAQASPALSPAHLAELAAGTAAIRKACRSAGVARFSGWTLWVFAAMTALGGLTDPVSLATAAGLGGLAWSELKGAEQVRRLDSRGPRRLVVNQFVLLGLIVVYAGLNIWRASQAGPPAGLEPTGDASVDQLPGEIGDMTKMITLGVYGCLVVVGVPVQLAMAGYHARRGRQLRECVASTPEWIRVVARAA